MTRNSVCLAASLALALFSSLVLAVDEGHLRSPEQLLADAKKGRIEYIQAVGEMQRFAPTLPSNDALYPYLRLLDPLEAVGKTLGVSSLGGDPLIEAAHALTMAATKFIRLDLDDLETLHAFFKWAADGSRGNAIGQQTVHLNLPQTKDQLKRWNAAAEKIVGWVTEYKAAAFVKASAEELQGSVVRKILQQSKEWTADELALVVKQTKSVVAAQEVLEYLLQVAARTEDTTELLRTIDWAILLATNLNALGAQVPFVVRPLPGQAILECLSHLLAKEVAPDLSKLDTLFGALQPSQISELASMLLLRYNDRPVPESLQDFVYRISRKLEAKYRYIAIEPRQREFKRLYDRLVMQRIDTHLSLEGTYAARVGNSPARFTVVNSGTGSFLMDVNLDRPGFGNQGYDYPLFQVTYNEHDHSFEAQHVANQPPEYANSPLLTWFLKFQVQPRRQGNVLVGTFSNQYGRFRFVAEQRQRYMKFESRGPSASEAVFDLNDIYYGSLGRRSVELHLARSGSEVTGLLYFPSEVFNVPFAYGYLDEKRRAVYMSSGEMENFNWIQVRGQLSENGEIFTGQYIVGGRGAMWNFRLARGHGRASHATPWAVPPYPRNGVGPLF